MTITTTPALPLLDELDELRAKATPGPWRVVATGGTDLFTGESYREVEVEFADPIENAGLILGEHELAETDAALIVAAVNAVPQLTAALRAVLTRLDFADGTSRAVHGTADGGAVWARDLRTAITTALEAS